MNNRISDFKSKVNPDFKINYGDYCDLNDQDQVTIKGFTYFYYTNFKRRDAYNQATAKSNKQVSGHIIKSLGIGKEGSKHQRYIGSTLYEQFKGRSKVVVICDWEFQSQINTPDNYKDFEEAKKVIHHNQFVIGSFYLPDRNEIRVYEHPTLGYGKIGSWGGETVLTDFIANAEEVDSKTAYEYFNGKGEITGYEIKLCHFYSAFDVFGCFRSDDTHQYIASQLEGGRILHGANFSSVRTGVFLLVDGKGYELTISIADFKGYAPTGGGGTLENTFKSQGMLFDNKELRKGFDIGRMAECYMNENELREINGVTKSVSDWVIDYTTDDGTYEMFEFLFLIHSNSQQTISNINQDYHLKYARTLGNIANQAGIAALSKQFGYDMENPEARYHLAFLQYLSSAYNWHSKDTTNNFLIATAGGMCKNFQPREYITEGIVTDIDWKGFYPSIMKVAPYCVGVPIVIDFHKNEVRNASENFNKYRSIDRLINKTLAKNLVPRAWKARITTKPEYTYKFRQNLILSFMVGDSSFDVTHETDVNSPLSLGKSRLRDEMPKGAITLNSGRVDCAEFTSDYMEFIDNYWTPRERKEFYENTLVDSIIFYDAEMELTPLEMRQKYEAGEVELKKIEIEVKKGRVIRTHIQNNYWCRVDTNEPWLNILDDKRSDFKAKRSEAKKAGDGESEARYDALQNSCKTINNGTAGVSMSGDYQTDKPSRNKKGTYNGKPKIGNVVFGANVTAAGRVATYCLATVARGHQIITDGCPANLNKFMCWDWEAKSGNRIRRIGANALYLLMENTDLSKDTTKNYFRNNVKIAPLLGREWSIKEVTYDEDDVDRKNPFVTITNGKLTGVVSDDNCEFLNPLVYEAVSSQFNKLSIFKGGTLKIEIKNVYQLAVFQSQANYMLMDFAGNKKIKARGYEIKKEVFDNPTLKDAGKEHPFKELIDLVSKNNGNPYYATKFQRTLHGVGEHNKTENVNQGYVSRGYLPHCSSIKTTTPRPISLSMFYFKTWKQRKLWHSLDDGLRNRTGGFGIEILCMSIEQLVNREYFDYSQAINEIQNLIDSMPTREKSKLIPEKSAIAKHRGTLTQLIKAKESLLEKHNISHPNQLFKSTFEG